MSLAHAQALEEISGGRMKADSIDLLGLHLHTIRHIKHMTESLGFNRVEIVVHLIQSLIIHGHKDGILDVPPPILSRVYQTISRGFVNYLNAKKIVDTRFPFPLAQLLTFFLIAFSVLTPLMFA